MKKGKKTMIITIGLICFILTYVIFLQFRTVEQTNIAQIEEMRESELREKLAIWKEKYEETNIEYEESTAKLGEYIQKKDSDQETSKLLEQELKKAQILAGKLDVKGEGIIITIKDGPSSENGRVSSYDLLDLVNELKLAGAEAISINDQRITNATDIVNVAVSSYDSTILVNSKRISAPYTIKVIGSQKYLESSLTTKIVGYIDTHSELDISIEKQNNVKIRKYEDEIKIKYAQVKEEE